MIYYHLNLMYQLHIPLHWLSQALRYYYDISVTRHYVAIINALGKPCSVSIGGIPSTFFGSMRGCISKRLRNFSFSATPDHLLITCDQPSERCCYHHRVNAPT